MADIATIDAADVQATLGSRAATVVDVRLPFDYFGGRIPGAINLPGSMIVERVGQIASDRRLIFVCDDGSDSADAAAIARDAGFTDVAVMSGGLDAWYDADLPIETASDGINIRTPD